MGHFTKHKILKRVKLNLHKLPFRGIAHTHTVYVCSSALTPSSTRSALPGPWDWLGHQDAAYHKSASHSLKHCLAEALKYTLEWAAAVCTAIPHLSVHLVQSLADIIEYNLEWAAAVCTVCTVFRSFLSALCVASEGPL